MGMDTEQGIEVQVLLQLKTLARLLKIESETWK